MPRGVAGKAGGVPGAGAGNEWGELPCGAGNEGRVPGDTVKEVPMAGGGAMGRVCRVGTGGRVPCAWGAGAGTGGVVADLGGTVGRAGFGAPAWVSSESVGLVRLAGGGATGFTSGSATGSGSS